MLNTIFSAYRALLFPVPLSWIRGRADVQSLKALGSQRQRLSMVSSKKPKMGRTLCGCGEGQGTQSRGSWCVCDCEGTGNRKGKCLSGAWVVGVYLTFTPFLNEGSLVRVTLPSPKLILNLDQNGSHQQKQVPARRLSGSL